MVDSLSKKALSLESGFGNCMESVNGMIIDHGNFQLFKALCWVLAQSFLHSFLFIYDSCSLADFEETLCLLIML